MTVQEIKKNIRIDEKTGCWIWLRFKDKEGYGHVWFNGRSRRVYKVLWEEKHGRITATLPNNVLDHIVCDNPSCCNPDHLQLTSTGVNLNRHLTEKTHCPQGHPYEGNNLAVDKYGHRYCLTCRNLRNGRRDKIYRIIHG